MLLFEAVLSLLCSKLIFTNVSVELSVLHTVFLQLLFHAALYPIKTNQYFCVLSTALESWQLDATSLLNN